ncbi:MAG: hypothetical protein AAF557_00910 [Pseudomonadota bacterium]
MLNNLLSKVLSAPDSPTADLYFRNACADFLGRGVRQVAPTVFASPTTTVIMRHAMRAGRLPERRRLIYLVDDDVEAGTSDQSLPFFYRQKLRMVEQPACRRIRRFAGVAVVGSPTLARLFAPIMQTHLIRPYWSERFACLDHFDGLERGQGWVDVAYLGSIVHRSDLMFLIPAIGRLLELHPNMRFHVPIRHRLPAELENHPRVMPIPGLGWTAYRRQIAGRRFHVTAYPLLDTPFNRARSANKLIEHAVVGAAPVYSSCWGEAQNAAEYGAGYLIPNDQEAWVQGLSGLIGNPDRMKRLAKRAQNFARTLNTAEPQRSLWRDLLELDAPAEALACA